MNLYNLIERFPDKESCISHLEQVRWGEHPQCPYCESDNVARKQENGVVGRWNCHNCKSSFNVLAGTLFQGTKIPLPKWFLAIALMVNVKTSMSSCQLARHLDLNQGSTWSMMQRIRKEMTRKEDHFLQRIIKTDEPYVGDKPRRRANDNGELPPRSKRGTGTKKTPIFDDREPSRQLQLPFNN